MTADTPAMRLPAPEPQPGQPLSRPEKPRWTLSVVDFNAHAVDERDDHPFGVFVALCGHRLLMGELHDDPPGGLCPGCSHAVVKRRADGWPVHWTRGTDDPRCHVVAHYDAAAGRAQASCGAALPWESPDLATQPSSPLCAWCVTGATAEPPQFGGT